MTKNAVDNLGIAVMYFVFAVLFLWTAFLGSEKNRVALLVIVGVILIAFSIISLLVKPFSNTQNTDQK